MKFDSSLAWKQASAAIVANREVLLALAGVFFLLPTLAFGLLYPQPKATPGMDQRELMAMMSDYYLSALPVALPMVLAQATGTLAMLTLFTDRSRPTVGEAIRRGIAAVVPYVLAQIVLGIGVGVAGGLLLAVGAVTGSALVIGLAIAGMVLIAVYAAIKTSLAAPVIAVEGERNPVAALRRSWALTRGNSARIGVFYFLVGIAFFLVITVAMALLGTVAALVGGPKAGETTSLVVSAVLGTGMTLCFVGIFAAVHRQLAGASPERLGETFE